MPSSVQACVKLRELAGVNSPANLQLSSSRNFNKTGLVYSKEGLRSE
jgi:hypothetical protein